MNYLITIIGPTAIGKTALSIALAQHFKCEIVSCDSRQFFKEMQIGTAVPTLQELEVAKHHFIQNKSIFQPYTVGDFEKEALAKLDVLFEQNNIQILVGGSGLYADAVCKGMDVFPAIDINIRELVTTKFQQYGLSFLQQTLAELDPDYTAILVKTNPQTLQNPQRMMRFVEVCWATNTPYSSFLNKKKATRNFIPIWIGLEAERAVLYSRINQRVAIMLQEGLAAEAQKLLPNKHLNALQTVGYREIFDFFEGKITFDCAVESIKQNTRRFAKRQLTWFKKNDEITWFDFETNHNEIIAHLEKQMNT